MLFLGIHLLGNAQIVDEVIGQKRMRVQALLKPFRILDYKKEREVHRIDDAITQTVLFENDTCKRFYWMVTPDGVERFGGLLSQNGYVPTKNGFAKDSLVLEARELNSGKAKLYIASISLENLIGIRDMAGRPVFKKKRALTEAEIQSMPLLQQAILEEEAALKEDSLPKKKKDPQRHWVGTTSGNMMLLGWEK